MTDGQRGDLCVLGVFGGAVVKAPEEGDTEIGTERAGVKGGGARIGARRGSGVALEIGRELVAAETRRDRARLDTGYIGNATVCPEILPGGVSDGAEALNQRALYVAGL